MCVVAPIVTIDPPQSPLTVFINDSLRLFCTAKGLPVPDTYWYEGDAPIIQQLPQLYLVPTKSPHTTNYTCVATNNAGGKRRQTSISIIVIVKGINIIKNNILMILIFVFYRFNLKKILGFCTMLSFYMTWVVTVIMLHEYMHNLVLIKYPSVFKCSQSLDDCIVVYILYSFVIYHTVDIIVCISPFLEKEKCPSFSSPENGRVFLLSDGKTAIFNCMSGYTIVGEGVLYCTDGKWSSHVPKCISAKEFVDKK